MSTAWSLRGDGLVRRYGSRVALDVTSVEVPAGSTLAVLGPSGAGKSTLLRVLGLLEPPDAGEVSIDGRTVTPGDRDARLGMAAVFQRPYLLRGSVSNNVAYGLRLRRVNHAERQRRVEEALDRVGLAGRGAESALRLSGGEAQRVSLARALVLEPRVLLLDEPLASIDTALKSRLAREFAQILREAGTTTVYVTHDQAEAAIVADRIAIMRDGCIAQVGRAGEVMGLPTDAWVASFLGMEASLSGRVEGVDNGLARIVCGGLTVSAISDSLTAGDDVLVAVRPEDVLLFAGEVELPPSSARNVLLGTISDVVGAGMTFRVTIDVAGTALASTVSIASRDELHLEPGEPVTVAFKASAVRVRRLGDSMGDL